MGETFFSDDHGSYQVFYDEADARKPDGAWYWWEVDQNGDPFFWEKRHGPFLKRDDAITAAARRKAEAA